MTYLRLRNINISSMNKEDCLLLSPPPQTPDTITVHDHLKNLGEVSHSQSSCYIWFLAIKRYLRMLFFKHLQCEIWILVPWFWVVLQLLVNKFYFNVIKTFRFNCNQCDFFLNRFWTRGVGFVNMFIITLY